MTRERLSYVLGKWVCWLRRGVHSYIVFRNVDKDTCLVKCMSCGSIGKYDSNKYDKTLAEALCELRGHHSVGPKRRIAEKWYQICPTCGHTQETTQPRKRGERRTQT